LDDSFLVFGLGRERLVPGKSYVSFPPGFMRFRRTPAMCLQEPANILRSRLSILGASFGAKRTAVAQRNRPFAASQDFPSSSRDRSFPVSVQFIDVSEIHDIAQQERIPHCHCGPDPQSSGGGALDPGSKLAPGSIRGPG